MLQVRNIGETGLDRFDAVELVGPSIADRDNAIDFDRLSLFDVQIPADPLAPAQLAIVQETIAPGKVGRAIAFGVSPCRELVVESEQHTRARAGASGELVSSDDGPASILWKSDASQATRRAVVAITQARAPAATRFGRIIASERDLDSWRWFYDVELVELDDQGIFQADPDLDPVDALNIIEAGNSSTGTQGNGVDADQLPQGFEIVPIGVGAVVELTGPYGATETEPGFYLFSVANLVDGVCQA